MRTKIVLGAIFCLAMSPLPSDQVPGATNPSVTQDTIGQTICRPGWSAKVRPSTSYTEPIKRELMQSYGATDPKEFELDHRLPIEVGGCPTCKSNLWLQQWHNPKHHRCDPVMMDAGCNDRLENYVNHKICAGKMTLAEGQSMFLGDWIASYRKLFQRHTQ